MSKEGVLVNARRLVQEAVDIADRAGIDPSPEAATLVCLIHQVKRQRGDKDPATEGHDSGD